MRAVVTNKFLLGMLTRTQVLQTAEERVLDCISVIRKVFLQKLRLNSFKSSVVAGEELSMCCNTGQQQHCLHYVFRKKI